MAREGPSGFFRTLLESVVHTPVSRILQAEQLGSGRIRPVELQTTTPLLCSQLSAARGSVDHEVCSGDEILRCSIASEPYVSHMCLASLMVDTLLLLGFSSSHRLSPTSTTSGKIHTFFSCGVRGLATGITAWCKFKNSYYGTWSTHRMRANNA